MWRLLTLHHVDCSSGSARSTSGEDGVRGLTLVSVAGAHADVAHVAGLDDIVESLHLHQGHRFSKYNIMSEYGYAPSPQSECRSQSGGLTSPTVSVLSQIKACVATHTAAHQCTRAVAPSGSPSRNQKCATDALCQHSKLPSRHAALTLRLNPFWLIIPCSCASASSPRQRTVLTSFGFGKYSYTQNWVLAVHRHVESVNR